MPIKDDELLEAIRELTDAIRDATRGGLGGASSGVGRGGKGDGAGSLGSLGKIAGRLANVAAGTLAADAAAEAFVGGGDPLAAAQLATARLAGAIPVLGQLTGFAAVTDTNDRIRSALAPLRALEEAGVDVSDRSIREVSQIAAARAKRGREFDARATEFVRDASAEAGAEVFLDSADRIIKAHERATDKIAEGLAKILVAIEGSFSGGGPR